MTRRKSKPYFQSFSYSRLTVFSFVLAEVPYSIVAPACFSLESKACGINASIDGFSEVRMTTCVTSPVVDVTQAVRVTKTLIYIQHMYIVQESVCLRFSTCSPRMMGQIGLQAFQLLVYIVQTHTDRDRQTD